MSLNVNPDVEDVYYRYKMPKINVKSEGKGNGKMSVITNISDIAKAIYRKPSYPIKYFGIELGSLTKIDDKIDRYVINGEHDESKFQELLYGFIRKFVLCSKCGNPETILIAKKKSEKIKMKCKACGGLTSCDIKHKLATYIMKHPPKTEAEGGPSAKSEENEAVEELESEFQNINVEPTESQKQEEVVEPSNVNTTKSDEDIFMEMIQEKIRNGTLMQDRKEVIKSLLKSKDFMIMVLMDAVFVNCLSLADDIENYKLLFQLLTRVGSRGESYQKYVIRGMVLLCDKFQLYSYAGHFLYHLYLADIIEESIILDWIEKGPLKKCIKNKVHRQQLMDSCQVFVNWLKEAEEEVQQITDDDDEVEDCDEDDLEADEYELKQQMDTIEEEGNWNEEVDIDDI